MKNNFLIDYGFSDPIGLKTRSLKGENMENKRQMKEMKSGDVVKFEKKGDSVSGTFISIEESHQFKDSYCLKLKNPAKEEPIVVFVSGIVPDLLKSNNIQPGRDIVLEYQGKEMSKKSGMPYHTYKLFA